MKKINRIAAQDAVRWVEARETLNEILTKHHSDPNYAKAVDAAVSKIDNNQTAVYVAQKMSTPTAVKLRRGFIIAAAVIILHETGTDELIWNKTKSAARYLRSKHRKVVAELKEEFPETAQKATDLKDAVVDTAQTAAGEAKAAYGDTGYDASYAPNISKENDPRADR